MVLANVETIGSRGWNHQSYAVAMPSQRPVPYVAETQRRIAQTVVYMRECLNQAVQVPKLARMANISPSHFFAVFKRQTGFAPLDYFIRLRMQRGCEILDGTLLSVKEIASELGYDDPFYFSRLFKTVIGVAPTDYRRMSEEHRHVIRARIWSSQDCMSLPSRVKTTQTETK